MDTPEARILREFQRLPRREHVHLLVAVMRQLGLTGFSRPQFLSRGGHAWMMLGVVVLASGAGLAFWHGKHPPPPRPPRTGWLQITTCPADARVMLDDRPIEDRTIITAPGSHVLTVTRPGYHESKESVWLTTDHQHRIHVPLLPTDATELANHMGRYRHEALHQRDVR